MIEGGVGGPGIGQHREDARGEERRGEQTKRRCAIDSLVQRGKQSSNLQPRTALAGRSIGFMVLLALGRDRAIQRHSRSLLSCRTLSTVWGSSATDRCLQCINRRHGVRRQKPCKHRHVHLSLLTTKELLRLGIRSPRNQKHKKRSIYRTSHVLVGRLPLPKNRLHVVPPQSQQRDSDQERHGHHQQVERAWGGHWTRSGGPTGKEGKGEKGEGQRSVERASSSKQKKN